MKHIFVLFFISSLIVACQGSLPQAKPLAKDAPIWPDYNGVTIPSNICPLNFTLNDSLPAIALISNGKKEIRVDAENGLFSISDRRWKEILEEKDIHSLQVTVMQQQPEGWIQYKPFQIHVSSDEIDPVLVYRRIQPAYRMWGEMGIYQRNLETFEEDVILSNSLTNNSCMNCHSFCQQNPDQMLFHQRSTYAGTYMLQNGTVEKLNTKVDSLPSALVYPSWHPSGRYVAFSSNDIKQDYHLQDANRIEVYDQESDVVVYDVEQHTILLNPMTHGKDAFETFPTFSPDGNTLYFCTSEAQEMPADYQKVKYNLCSQSFNPKDGSFGTEVDTLVNAAQENMSVSFPRVSPDSRYIMYTKASYGNFSIWHKDADLHLMDLATGQELDMSAVNSADVDSYHSWSSNCRWFVFSSRRIDGLYTRPYLCHIDEAGKMSKPFILPQKDPRSYELSLYSYNIPELVKGTVQSDVRELVEVSRYHSATPVKVK